MSRLANHKKLQYAAFAAMLASLAAYLGGRYFGAYPSVFADEQAYSYYSRLAALEDAIVPSFLYLWVYKLTSSCGSGFLDCARYLNIAFHLGAAPFIYLTARSVASRPLAIIAAVVAVAAPSSNYVAFFMPESMYFFGFAVLAWLALRRSSGHWAAYAAASGAWLGLMALVKVHAVFLAPSLALFTLYRVWAPTRGMNGLRPALAAAALNLAAMYAVKTAAGYALVGPTAWHLLGSFYGSHASAGTPLMTLLPAAWISLKGHLMQLVLVFALPSGVLLHHAFSREERERDAAGTAALLLFTFLVLGAAFMLSVVYTSTIAGLGPDEGIRLHARYYNFALWLLVVVALVPRTGGPRRALPCAIALVLVAALAYAAGHLALEYKIILVDTPEMESLGLGRERTLAYWILALHAVLLMLWPISRRLAGIGYVVLFMPAFLVNAHLMTIKHVTETHQATPYDVAGRYVRDNLSLEERNQVRIAGDSQGGVLRTQFHVDARYADVMVLQPGSPLEPYMLPARKRWLLLVADHPLPPGVVPVVSHPLFKLVRTAVDNQSLGVAEFSKPLPDSAGLLTGAEGLSAVEPWGRWSDSPQVTLHFAKPLPARLNLFLTMQAFGPNAGKDVVVRIGDVEKRIRVQPSPSEIYLAFDTDGTQRSVTIVVPEPVTPKSMGHGVDERTLGLGLLRVEVGRR